MTELNIGVGLPFDAFPGGRWTQIMASPNRIIYDSTITPNPGDIRIGNVFKVFADAIAAALTFSGPVDIFIRNGSTISASTYTMPAKWNLIVDSSGITVPSGTYFSTAPLSICTEGGGATLVFEESAGGVVFPSSSPLMWMVDCSINLTGTNGSLISLGSNNIRLRNTQVSALPSEMVLVEAGATGVFTLLEQSTLADNVVPGAMTIPYDSSSKVNDQNGNEGVALAATPAETAPSVFVFRPGGVQAGNVYTDLASLASYVTAQNIPAITINCDFSAIDPTDGYYTLNNETVTFGSVTAPIAVTLNGVTVTITDEIYLYFTGGLLQLSGSTTINVFTLLVINNLSIAIKDSTVTGYYAAVFGPSLGNIQVRGNSYITSDGSAYLVNLPGPLQDYESNSLSLNLYDNVIFGDGINSLTLCQDTQVYVNDFASLAAYAIYPNGNPFQAPTVYVGAASTVNPWYSEQGSAITVIEPSLPYSPGTPGNWETPPTQVAQALDELASTAAYTAQFVFRPGGTANANANVFTSFSTLVSTMFAQFGAFGIGGPNLLLVFDGTASGNLCEITSGSYRLPDNTAFFLLPGTTVQIDDGVSFHVQNMPVAILSNVTTQDYDSFPIFQSNSSSFVFQTTGGARNSMRIEGVNIFNNGSATEIFNIGGDGISVLLRQAILRTGAFSGVVNAVVAYESSEVDSGAFAADQSIMTDSSSFSASSGFSGYTNITLADTSLGVTYGPGVSANWGTSPTQVAQALDDLQSEVDVFIFAPGGTTGPNTFITEASLADATQAFYNAGGQAYTLVFFVESPYTFTTVGTWNLAPGGTWTDLGAGYTLIFANGTTLPAGFSPGMPVAIEGALQIQVTQSGSVGPSSFNILTLKDTVSITSVGGGLFAGSTSPFPSPATGRVELFGSASIGGTDGAFAFAGSESGPYEVALVVAAYDGSLVQAGAIFNNSNSFVEVVSPNAFVDASLFQQTIIGSVDDEYNGSTPNQGIFIDTTGTATEGGGIGILPDHWGHGTSTLIFSNANWYYSNGTSWVPVTSGGGPVDASAVTYEPGTPADWPSPPTQVAQALDDLAAGGANLPFDTTFQPGGTAGLNVYTDQTSLSSALSSMSLSNRVYFDFSQNSDTYTATGGIVLGSSGGVTLVGVINPSNGAVPTFNIAATPSASIGPVPIEIRDLLLTIDGTDSNELFSIQPTFLRLTGQTNITGTAPGVGWGWVVFSGTSVLSLEDQASIGGGAGFVIEVASGATQQVNVSSTPLNGGYSITAGAFDINAGGFVDIYCQRANQIDPSYFNTTGVTVVIEEVNGTEATFVYPSDQWSSGPGSFEGVCNAAGLISGFSTLYLTSNGFSLDQNGLPLLNGDAVVSLQGISDLPTTITANSGSDTFVAIYEFKNITFENANLTGSMVLAGGGPSFRSFLTKVSTIVSSGNIFEVPAGVSQGWGFDCTDCTFTAGTFTVGANAQLVLFLRGATSLAASSITLAGGATATLYVESPSVTIDSSILVQSGVTIHYVGLPPAPDTVGTYELQVTGGTGGGPAWMTVPGAGASSTFVFDPAGTAGGNVYTTWSSLAAAAASLEYALIYTPGGTIPSGSYTMPNTWDLYIVAGAQLTIDDGASFSTFPGAMRNVGGLGATGGNGIISSGATSTVPFQYGGGSGAHDVVTLLFDGVTLECTGDGPVFYATPNDPPSISVTLINGAVLESFTPGGTGGTGSGSLISGYLGGVNGGVHVYSGSYVGTNTLNYTNGSNVDCPVYFDHTGMYEYGATAGSLYSIEIESVINKPPSGSTGTTMLAGVPISPIGGSGGATASYMLGVGGGSAGNAWNTYLGGLAGDSFVYGATYPVPAGGNIYADGDWAELVAAASGLGYAKIFCYNGTVPSGSWTMPPFWDLYVLQGHTLVIANGATFTTFPGSMRGVPGATGGPLASIWVEASSASPWKKSYDISINGEVPGLLFDAIAIGISSLANPPVFDASEDAGAINVTLQNGAVFVPGNTGSTGGTGSGYIVYGYPAIGGTSGSGGEAGLYGPGSGFFATTGACIPNGTLGGLGSPTVYVDSTVSVGSSVTVAPIPVPPAYNGYNGLGNLDGAPITATQVGPKGIPYTPGNSAYWSGNPTTVQQALDRIAAVVGASTPIP